MKTIKATFLLIFTFLVYATSIAQWTTDTDINTLVVDSEGGDMQAIAASNGYTYVVFWKVVPEPVYYELRLQILDTDGIQLLGSNGILVSNTIPMSTYTVLWNITVDSNDNLYIGATGTGGGDPAFVFKLDINGNQLWGSNGVNVGAGNAVSILPLSSGEAIVSWLSSSLFQAEIQKYDASGNAIWTETQIVEEGTNSTIPANMFELSNGDFIMVFHSLLNGINTNLFAQRFNNLGETQWGLPTKLANKVTRFNTSYDGVQDGDTLYIGYTGITNTRFDSFLQRLNPDGSIPWGIDGVDFDTNETDYEIDTKIAFTPSSQYIWSSCIYTDSSQSERGEYIQKFDKDSGARLFTDNAKVVYAIGEEKVHSGSLQLKNDSPLILLKSGFDNGATPVTLSTLYLDENGDFAWPEETRPIATYSANKSRIQFTKLVNEQAVAVFIEDKGNGEKIYAQNSGEVVLSIDDVNIENTIFYKNPVLDNWKIKSENIINSISIYNVLGQSVFEINDCSSKEILIQTQTWKSGIYILKVSTEIGVLSKQIIKN